MAELVFLKEVDVDHDFLRGLLRRIALASAPFLAGGCVIPPCPSRQQRTLPVVSDSTGAGSVDGGIEDLIARCQASAADCIPLCERVLRDWSGGGGQSVHECELVMDNGGFAVNVDYTPVCGSGRRPEGLAASTPTGRGSALGVWLAASAHLEAASIDAFAILAGELETHGSPRALVRAARAAAGDERRHARVMGRLAVRHGAKPPAVRLTRSPIRDIETIARENAVEGCVRETLGALVAWRQAGAAGDPAVRAAMGGIAGDETRHAALSWAIDAWSPALLTPAARRRVREARHEAIAALLAAPSRGPSAILREQAGLPGEEELVSVARLLADELAAVT